MSRVETGEQRRCLLSHHQSPVNELLARTDMLMGRDKSPPRDSAPPHSTLWSDRGVYQ